VASPSRYQLLAIAGALGMVNRVLIGGTPGLARRLVSGARGVGAQRVVTICNGTSDICLTDPARPAPVRRTSPHRDIKWAG
jgi:hypothetical protein